MKALVFTGMAHHCAKMASTFRYLEERGVSLKYLLVTNASQSSNFESALLDFGAAPIPLDRYLSPELAQTISAGTEALGAALWARFQMDGRARIWECIPPATFLAMVHETQMCAAAFRAAVEQEEPDFVLVLHELNYWAKLLSDAARRHRVPVFTLQEGLYQKLTWTGRFYSLMADRATQVFLWGDQARRLFIEEGADPARISVVGPPHLDWWARLSQEERREEKLRARQKLGISASDTTLLLAMPHLWQAEHAMAPRLRRTIQWLARDGIRLLIRFHPYDELRLKQTFDRYCSDIPGVLLAQILDFDGLLKAADAVVTQGSTSAMEALVYGLPVFEVQLAGLTGKSLAEAGLGLPIDSQKSADAAIDLVRSGGWTPPSASDALRDAFSQLDGRANERIWEGIRRFL